MPTRRGATTVTARRGPHLVGGSGAAVAGGGVSGLVQPRPLPPRSSQTKFVSERGLLRRRDLFSGSLAPAPESPDVLPPE